MPSSRSSRSAVQARAEQSRLAIERGLQELAEATVEAPATTVDQGVGTSDATTEPMTEIGGVMVQRIQTTNVDITMIDEDPNQHRKFNGPYSHEDPGHDVAELAATIRSRGLLQPIVIRPYEARFRVVVGARRLRAFRHLAWRFPGEQWDYIPAVTWRGPLTRAIVLAMQIIENGQRENPDPASTRQAYLALRAELGGNARAVMRILGIGHTTYYRVTGEKPNDDGEQPVRKIGLKAANRTSIGQLTRILETFVDRVATMQPDQCTQLERALTPLVQALQERLKTVRES